MASQRNTSRPSSHARVPSLRSWVVTGLVFGLASLGGCTNDAGGGDNFQVGSDTSGGDTSADGRDSEGADQIDVPVGEEARELNMSEVPLEMVAEGHTVDSSSNDEQVDFSRVIARDISGDGFADFIGLTADGRVYAKVFQRTALRPPFEFGAMIGPLSTGIDQAELDTGDFDGDSLPDIVVVGRRGDTRGVSVIFNAGAGHFEAPRTFDDPLVGFDDPLVGFDDPLVGFDDPLVGFDDPLVGRRHDWVVGDFDGNGFDDLLLLRDAQTMTLVSTGPARDSLARRIDIEARTLRLDRFDDPLVGFDDPLVGFDDPLVGAPVVLSSIEVDGDAAAEFALGFATEGQGSAVVFFDDPLVGFDDPLVGFDDPLVGLVGVGVRGSLRDFKVAALDDFSAAALSLATLSTIDGNSALTIADVQSFDDPLVGLNLARRTVDGEFGRLAATRMVDTTAQGASGLHPVSASHFLLVGAERVLAVTHDGADWVGRELAIDEKLAEVEMTDFNGDGYAELVPRSGGFAYQGQVELSADTLAGTPELACSVEGTLCQGGTLGVCADRRLDCEGGCVPLEGTDTSTVYSATDEALCDRQDNDCDGRVDVLGASRTLTLELEGATGATLEHLRVAETSTGPKALIVTDDGSTLSFFHQHVDLAAGTVKLASDDAVQATGVDRQLVFDLSNDELCVLASGPTTTGFIFDSTGGATPVGVQVDDLSTASVVQADRWLVVHASGGELVVSSADGQINDTVFDYEGAIRSTRTVAVDDGMLVTFVTESDKLVQLYVVSDGAGGYTVRDVHQMQLAAGSRIAGLAAAASTSPTGDAGACLVYAERSSEGVPRLMAQRFDVSTDGLRLGTHTTLSLRDVDGESLVAASLDGTCQVAWSERLPGDDGLRLLRHAYLEDTPVIQEIGTTFGSGATSLAMAASDARLATAMSAQLDATATVDISLDSLCH